MKPFEKAVAVAERDDERVVEPVPPVESRLCVGLAYGERTFRQKLIAIFGNRELAFWFSLDPIQIGIDWREINLQLMLEEAGLAPFLHPDFLQDDLMRTSCSYAEVDFIKPLRSRLQIPNKRGKRRFTHPAVSISKVPDADNLNLAFGHLIDVGGEWKMANANQLAAPAPVTYFKQNG